MERDFNKAIEPFFWSQGDSSVSFCLNIGTFRQEVFDRRADDGFEGGGYDWASLARVFLAERLPQFEQQVCFDPEADMFCAYAKHEDEAALREFARAFRAFCDDEEAMGDLLSRAELMD
ncbi:MAG: Imm51 family immunity protein [Neisseria sp.]|nr:Imm51 family immunity protein [Neisseria sp.]